jgi:hypothetical protein
VTSDEGEWDVGEGKHDPFASGAAPNPDAAAEALEGSCHALLGVVQALLHFGRPLRPGEIARAVEQNARLGGVLAAPDNGVLRNRHRVAGSRGSEQAGVEALERAKPQGG